jgi:prevent-host-death family protein
MGEISAQELARQTSGILRRVEAGDRVRVSVDGRPVAELVPLGQPLWIRGAAIEDVLRDAPADPGLLRDIAPIRGEQAGDR